MIKSIYQSETIEKSMTAFIFYGCQSRFVFGQIDFTSSLIEIK